MCGRNFIFCFETNVFVFLLIMESHLCVLQWVVDRLKGIIQQLWNFLSSSLPFSMPCHTDQAPWLPECSWAPLPAVAAWRPPESREQRSHQVGVCAHLPWEEPSPGTPTACCSGSENSFLFCSAFKFPMVGEQVRHCSYYRCRKGTLCRALSGLTLCWQSQRLGWRGARGGTAAGWGSPGDFSATWPAFSGFMLMGLVSGCLWPSILTRVGFM